MPNWCFTSFVVRGDKKQRRDLYDKMKSLEDREESLVPNDFGKEWLGNLVTILGGYWENVRCRGSWSDLQNNGDIIRFDIESAWSYPEEMIAFLKQSYPGLEFLFSSEESGMGIYVTNDAKGEYFPDRFILEVGEDEPVYFTMSEQEKLFCQVERLVGKEVRSLKDVTVVLDEYNADKEWEDGIRVKVYEVI